MPENAGRPLSHPKHCSQELKEPRPILAKGGCLTASCRYTIYQVAWSLVHHLFVSFGSSDRQAFRRCPPYIVMLPEKRIR